MRTIKALLVDDQVLFVENLRIVLDHMCDDIETVGVALDGEEALSLLRQCGPDIVLLDIRMPGLSGCELVEKMKSIKPDVQIVMLTTFDDDEYIHEALERGAIGYLLKGIAPNELIESIRAVMSHQVVVSPMVAQKLIQGRRERVLDGLQPTGARTQPVPSWINDLTIREHEVVRLIAQGFDNRQIAEKISVAEQTVRNYVHEIYAKMDVHNRLEAMRRLSEIHLTDLGV